MSWQAALMRWQIRRRYRPRGEDFTAYSPEDLAAAFVERATSSSKYVPKPPRTFQVETTDHGAWVHLSDVPPQRTVFYCHGGGYVWGSSTDYYEFAARLCRTLQAEVFLLDYRLAPAHQCPAPLEDSVAAWQAALARGMDPNRTMIAGDSAGGGLTLATLQALKQNGLPLPAATWLISPLLDLTGSGESHQTRDKADPMLSPVGVKAVGQLYCGDQVALDDWRASPLFGDLDGLPPFLIQVGDCEILLSDSQRLDEKLQALGIRSDLQVWPRMFHVWQLAAFFLPEGRHAIEKMAGFAKEIIP